MHLQTLPRALPVAGGGLRLPGLNNGAGNRDLSAALERIAALEKQNAELKEAGARKDAVLAQVRG